MMYGVRDDTKNLKKSRKNLRWIYDQIPETKGCMENNSKSESEGGCGSWCCAEQFPQVLYVEFLNAWSNILNNWTDAQITNLIGRSLRQYLFGNIERGCVFWNKETKLCGHHQQRPLACFLPNTWLFTKNGPKQIKDIHAGDYVYSHDGKIHLVLNSMSKLYNGSVLNIKPQGNTIHETCTSEHKWFITRQRDKRKNVHLFWESAENLIEKYKDTEGDYLSYPRIFHNTNTCKSINCADFISALRKGDRLYSFVSNKQQASLPLHINIDDNFLFMIGLYLAEGSASNFCAQFSMNINEKPILERIQQYLLTLGIRSHFNKTKNNNNLALSVLNAGFGKLMKSLCGYLANNKAINEDFFGMLSNKQLFTIFEAWHVGDGRRPSHKNGIAYSGTTISEKLILQMQQICLMNGLYPRIRKDIKRKDGRISYCININQSSFDNWAPQKGQGSKVLYNDVFVMYPLSEVNKKQYCGPVFDISVEDSESFITSSGIAHNCRVYGITPDEEFKPRYERLKIIYPLTRPQCNLVSTVNGQVVTKSDTDRWWQQLNAIEASIGVKAERINDDDGGSYRAYHDHILIHILGEDGMGYLSAARTSEDLLLKEDVYSRVMKSLDLFKSRLLEEKTRDVGKNNDGKTENQDSDIKVS